VDRPGVPDGDPACRLLWEQRQDTPFRGPFECRSDPDISPRALRSQ
jgi:hypothetical protein